MGQAMSWMFEKRQAMKDEFAHVQGVMDKIQTRVHPLNKEVCQAVHDSASHKDAKKIIFSQEERPNSEIRFLNFNTLMLPIFPKGPKYKAGY